MKKVAFIIVALSVFAACKPERTVHVIKTEIVEKKNELLKLSKELDSIMAISADTIAKKDKRVPVSVQNIAHERFDHFIDVSGVVMAQNEAFISPEVGGQIKRIYVEEGQLVSKGQLLVELNTGVSGKGIEELKTALDLATIVFNKQKELWDQKIGSEMQFLQAKNAKESLEKKLETMEAQVALAMIKAPFSGIVDGIFKKEGEMGMPGMQLLLLIDLAKMKIETEISESYLSSIKKGDSVVVSFPSYPELVSKIPVDRVGNTVNPNNRTFKVLLKIDNTKSMLKPNMISALTIKDFSSDSSFVLPSIIINKDLAGKSFVFEAVEKDGLTVARKVFIKTGISFKDETMVTGGLSVGQKIIIKGFSEVTNNREVKIVG